MRNAIALSLISHTNAGKTTLARTLLGRDVGEVRDAALVTYESTPYPLIDTPEGDALILWDTPGFGDSARLARRLAHEGDPIGWFLTQVWDRFRDRAFWHSQTAARNVREQADVVLYLVNASEQPVDAGYLQPELDVLAWIGKPVVALLNQTGPSGPAEEDRADEARWRAALGSRPCVRAVITLDAFARCWVQEIALLDLVGDALPAGKRPSFGRLAAAWQAHRMSQFTQSLAALAEPIAKAACHREPLPAADLKATLRDVGRTLGFGSDDPDSAKTRAAQALAARLACDLRVSTDRLIAIHQLRGHAAQELVDGLTTAVSVDAPVSTGKAAMMGGAVSGALTGVAADLASGGLTFGAGLLTGAVLGVLGGAGLAHGVNVARGKTGAALRWDDAFLTEQVAAALLLYLAIAHYGRGRGDWVATAYPAHWRPLVSEIVAARGAALRELWARREAGCDAEGIGAALRELLVDAAYAALERLYPGALVAGSNRALRATTRISEAPPPTLESGRER